jgi:hypothetical protein
VRPQTAKGVKPLSSARSIKKEEDGASTARGKNTTKELLKASSKTSLHKAVPKVQRTMTVIGNTNKSKLRTNK